MSKRIAITVQSKDGLKSILDPRFGRATAYLIVDSETNDVLAELANANIEAAHGAGTGAAAVMNANRVEAVISGRFGPKAFQSLETFQIEMWTAPEGLDAEAILMRYKAGTLQQVSGATNAGHPGDNGNTPGGGMGGGGMGGGRGRGMGGGGKGGRGMGGGGMGGGNMGGGRGRGMGGGGKGGGPGRNR